MNICEYGCGREAVYKMSSGKWCCENYYSKCPAIIKKQNKGRKFKLFENPNNYLCSYGCGQIAKYKKSNKLCCENHHTKCTLYREYTKLNNPMDIPDVKLKHKLKMKQFIGENNPLHTCDGALERHRESQRSKETRNKKSIATLKAVEKGIHPMLNKDIRLKISKKLTKPIEDMKKYICYYKKVQIETNHTLIIYKDKDKIKNLNLRGRKYGYDLDHKYSIYEGFVNNIDPKLIGHYLNLEIIKSKINCTKQSNCTITIEQLKKSIDNL